MCSAWMTHAQSHASFTNWRRKKWRNTRRTILLFVLSKKTTKERFLLKLCRRNGNWKRLALPVLYRANSTAGKSLTHWILSGSFIIYSLKRAISGLMFTLLLVFYYSTKITLGVVLALLYKRPVSINRPEKISHFIKAEVTTTSS